MLKKCTPLLFLPLLLAGCTTVFTNLTPLQQTRDSQNLYKVEVAIASRQQTMRWQSIKPQIIVGTESYPMRPTPLMTNRFEGLIPVAPTADTVQYHYKFDFEQNAFGPPRPDSASSPVYTLKIKEPQPNQ